MRRLILAAIIAVGVELGTGGAGGAATLPSVAPPALVQWG